MKLLLVSISIEFPLANYCLQAQIRASERLTGCEIDLLDLDWKRLSSYERKNAETWRYLAHVEQARPDLIGFSVYLWNHLAARELASITRLLFPSVTIVVGGPELATPEAASEWLATGAVDVAVRGEGERTFEVLVERLAQHDPPAGIHGTSWIESGTIQHEPARPPLKELSELASPFLDGLVSPDIFERENGPAAPARYSRVLLESYRGCYMQCSYCQWGNGSKARFPFPAERLFAEITWLLSHRVKRLFFVDAMFGYKKSTAIALLEHIIVEKRRFDAHTEIALYHNQDFFDPHLLELYREAGACIEVDLQSTNRQVLTGLGRGRWFTDSFDRHVTAIHEQRVPTTGAADLIIGIPGDTLASFENSVDFLLRRGMRVNLYQASILPETGWSRSIQEDGTIFSRVPPRAVFQNRTFPLRDMITARLIGHGTDLFNMFPQTAALLWQRWFERPVDLCRAIGEAVFHDHGLMYGESHQYDVPLHDLERSLGQAVRTLCPDAREADILTELLTFEGALAAEAWAPGPYRVHRADNWRVADAAWLDEQPEFRQHGVRRICFRYPVHQLALDWHRCHDPHLIEKVAERPCAVLFFNDGRAQHFPIDLAVTDRLLRCFNGYFTVRQALDRLDLHWADMSPIWRMLSDLAESGIIAPGDVTAVGAGGDREQASAHS